MEDKEEEQVFTGKGKNTSGLKHIYPVSLTQEKVTAVWIFKHKLFAFFTALSGTFGIGYKIALMPGLCRNRIRKQWFVERA